MIGAQNNGFVRRRARRRAQLHVGVATVALALAATDVPATADAPKGPPKLTWSPPRLSAPEHVSVPDRTPGPAGLVLTLDTTRDYVVHLSSLSGDGGLVIAGGRNVVLVGGRIDGGEITGPGEGYRGRCLTIDGATGIVHVEGVLLAGCGTAIYVSAPRAILQVQNVRANDVDAPWEYQHPDVIQTVRGPREVRIDRLTADFSSKGFLWMSTDGTFPARVDQRHVNFRLWSRGGARPAGPHIYTWHVSRSTRSTCVDCWTDQGFYGTSRRRLQDGWGTFDAEDSGTEFVPYRITRVVRTRKKQRRLVLTVHSRQEHAASNGTMGRRAGDTIELLAPSLAGERWRFGIPRGGDFVPERLVGASYRSPGYAPRRPLLHARP